MQPNNKVQTSGRRLILGYDGGCFTCGDLAERIEERIEGKIEVRNLRDPEVRQWRERAFGNDAPWAPTLFEIKGAEVVRAWTGWKMAANMSRFLGPVASWRVMEELGGDSVAPPVAENRTEMSRARFLRGAVGTVVAASAISSGILLPSRIALGQTPPSNATANQRLQATRIIRPTRQFQSLQALQQREGATFDFANAYIRIYGRGRRALVVVGSQGQTISVVAAFRLSLAYSRLLSYNSRMLGYVEQRNELKVTRFINGRMSNTNHRTIVGNNYVITQDNRIWTHEEFEQKVKDENQQARQVTSSYGLASSAYQNCVNAGYVECDTIADYTNAAIFGLSVALAPVSVGQSLTVGVAGFAAVAAAEAACRDEVRVSCNSQASMPPIQQPPSYYC